jgi:hypothetical protein
LSERKYITGGQKFIPDCKNVVHAQDQGVHKLDQKAGLVAYFQQKKTERTESQLPFSVFAIGAVGAVLSSILGIFKSKMGSKPFCDVEPRGDLGNFISFLRVLQAKNP